MWAGEGGFKNGTLSFGYAKSPHQVNFKQSASQKNLVHNHSLRKRLLWKKGKKMLSLNVVWPCTCRAAGVDAVLVPQLLCLSFVGSSSQAVLITGNFTSSGKFILHLTSNAQFIYLRRQITRNWAVFCNRSSSKVECPFLSKSYKLCLISLIQILTCPNVLSHLCTFKHAPCHLE